MVHITHDGTLDIAVGKSRKEKNWKNKEWQWSDLVKKLSNTHRTAETYAEYLASKKPRQDEIKDIGGFVGGYLNGGRRKAGSVVHRQLVTLDIDFGVKDLWGEITLLFGNAAAMYSTHKHSPEHPRLRLIMPLDREVVADEYQAIARWIAGQIGIEYFDHTTFEPSRLMYWPSTAKDGVFLFEYQDGPWLAADEILAHYLDWRDASEWPQSERESSIVQRTIQKQGDPLEKPGIVGAFCRTYDIHQAIDSFLADAYEPCEVEDRYSYKEGSTAAGLVVYDDKYAYSHHGTDPVSGKLCNAFDLVRIHKFGLRDEEASENTPVNKLPSYKAMTDWCSQLPEVRKLVVNEKIADAKMDFEFVSVEDEEEEQDDSWKEQLEVDKHGNVYSTTNNVILVLENDPMMKGRFAMDLFEKREVALRDLPWRKITHSTRYMTDVDDAGIRHYLETVYGITGVQKIKDGLDLVVMKHAFHPVREYLESLEWDGRPRVDRLLIDYLGAADTPYTRAVIRKALAAAVTRIYRPGAKYDYVPVLVGEQGRMKSMFINRLGMAWYSDSIGTVQGKEAFEALQGVWILELAELAQLKKAEVEQVKHFISKQEDRYRVAYGRRTENFPRQCIFFGTSNTKGFLRDATGNRRFWPIQIDVAEPYKNVADDMHQAEIDQIWAEAVHIYRKGEPLHLSAEVEKMAQHAQREHNEVDDRAGLISYYLSKPVPANWEEMDTNQRRQFMYGEDELFPEGVAPKQTVCAAEIWEECLNGNRKDMNTHSTKFIHDIMRNMPGWVELPNKIRFGKYGLQRGYARV